MGGGATEIGKKNPQLPEVFGDVCFGYENAFTAQLADFSPGKFAVRGQYEVPCYNEYHTRFNAGFAEATFSIHLGNCVSSVRFQ